jgi:hypothetical protein
VNCQEFESLFISLLQGKISFSAAETCKAHREICPNCQELWELARLEVVRTPLPEEEKLLQSVMGKTSGRACGKARELMPDQLDHQLPQIHSALLQEHLNSCDSCNQFYFVLSQLPAELRALAELDPGPSFTWQVMEATLCDKPIAQAITTRPAWNWSRWLGRPRLVWEIAYIGTVLFFVLLKGFAIFPDFTPGESLGTLQAKPLAVWDSTKEAVKQNWNLGVADWATRNQGVKKKFSIQLKEISETFIQTGKKSQQHWQLTWEFINQQQALYWEQIGQQLSILRNVGGKILYLPRSEKKG